MNKRKNLSNAWLVYLLECADGTYYTGITNHLENRLEAHNRGQGAKYTRGRLPVSLIAKKEVANQSQALKEEFEIKKLSRDKKLSYFKML